MKENKRIRVALLFGGKSYEHKVSLCSSLNIIRNINKKKYELVLIGIDNKGNWILCNENNYLFNCDNPSSISLIPTQRYLGIIPSYNKKLRLIDTTNLKLIKPIDVIFLLLHGNNGENGSIQGLFNILGVPYIGSNVLGSAICMNKDITKTVLRNAGILVAPSIVLSRKECISLSFDYISNKLGLPLIIKPTNQGSSIGVSKVANSCTFNTAIKLALRYNQKILIEQAITGREIEIGIIGNGNLLKTSVCGEVVFKNKFYDYYSKYLNYNKKSRLIIPAILNNSIVKNIQEISKKAYSLLNCNIMARLDFFLTKQGKIILNEVNTLPGFTTTSSYIKLWEASGLNCSELIDKLITLSLINKFE